MTDEFNKLTPAETERLYLLIEECGEVIQAAGKILRHGYDSKHPLNGPEGFDNRWFLEREVGDVLAIIEMMVSAGDTTYRRLIEERTYKLMRVRPYLHHQDSYEESADGRTEDILGADQ